MIDALFRRELAGFGTEMLTRMGARLDHELHDATQRRIATLTAEDLGT